MPPEDPRSDPKLERAGSRKPAPSASRRATGDTAGGEGGRTGSRPTYLPTCNAGGPETKPAHAFESEPPAAARLSQRGQRSAGARHHFHDWSLQFVLRSKSGWSKSRRHPRIALRKQIQLAHRKSDPTWQANRFISAMWKKSATTLNSRLNSSRAGSPARPAATGARSK